MLFCRNVAGSSRSGYIFRALERSSAAFRLRAKSSAALVRPSSDLGGGVIGFASSHSCARNESSVRVRSVIQKFRRVFAIRIPPPLRPRRRGGFRPCYLGISCFLARGLVSRLGSRGFFSVRLAPYNVLPESWNDVRGEVLGAASPLVVPSRLLGFAQRFVSPIARSQ